MQSNVGLVIEERAADIGNFLVGRLLPFRQKRAVGPFVFIDHMGPAQLKDHENLDVPPHPHIGLSTLTYLLEGSIYHRDSLGNAVEIKPGEVNWMTAGKGVVHSERTPEYLRDKEDFLHGFQIWVGLPKEKENMEAQFHHISGNELPQWTQGKAKFKLIAGTIGDISAPVPVHSPMYFLKITTDATERIDIGWQLFGEVALYILDGGVLIEGEEYGPKQMLVAKDSSLCAFSTLGPSTIFIFGGKPFPEARHMYWNFVHSDKTVIEQAKQNWQEQNLDAFPKIMGDDKSYVPLPEPKHA